MKEKILDIIWTTPDTVVAAEKIEALFAEAMPTEEEDDDKIILGEPDKLNLQSNVICPI